MAESAEPSVQITSSRNQGNNTEDSESEEEESSPDEEDYETCATKSQDESDLEIDTTPTNARTGEVAALLAGADDAVASTSAAVASLPQPPYALRGPSRPSQLPLPENQPSGIPRHPIFDGDLEDYPEENLTPTPATAAQPSNSKDASPTLRRGKAPANTVNVTAQMIDQSHGSGEVTGPAAEPTACPALQVFSDHGNAYYAKSPAGHVPISRVQQHVQPSVTQEAAPLEEAGAEASLVPETLPKSSADQHDVKGKRRPKDDKVRPSEGPVRLNSTGTINYRTSSEVGPNVQTRSTRVFNRDANGRFRK